MGYVVTYLQYKKKPETKIAKLDMKNTKKSVRLCTCISTEN